MRLRRQHRFRFSAIPQSLCCITLAALPACQPCSLEAPFVAQSSDCDTTLPATLPATRKSPPPDTELPPPRAGHWEIPAASRVLDHLDILQLRGCSVQGNVNRRQTRLGQYAKPSQRLLLELEYLRQAPACIHHLRYSNAPALADLLDAVRQETLEQLPTLIFHATLGSDEYRGLWLPAPAPGAFPRSDPGQMMSALATINQLARRWLNGDYRAQNRDLELQLSEIAGGDADLCLALSGRRYQAVIPSITELEQLLAKALPPAYRAWMSQRDRRGKHLHEIPARCPNRLNQARRTCGNGEREK